MSSNYKYDDEYQEEDDTSDQYNEAANQKTRQSRRRPEKDCNSRLEELAKPRRWILLGTWQCHGFRFEPERMQAMKDKIQELFSMSPEETEIYFNSIRNNKRKRGDARLLRGRIRDERLNAKKEAHLLLYKLIRKGIKYSYKKAPPLLVTPVLRTISDNILELLSEIHKVEIPKRSDNDKFSQFLISLADWTAMFVANIYYEVEVDERNEIENMKYLQNNRSSTTTSKVGGTTQSPTKKQTESDLEYQTKFIDYDEDEDEAGQAEDQI